MASPKKLRQPESDNRAVEQGLALAKRTKDVIKAVEDYDLYKSPSWPDLDDLSDDTSVDAVDVDPAGIIFEPKDQFHGLANVYVLLQYREDQQDGFETSDSFLGRFEGHFDTNGTPVIDKISIDTSPFYEGEREDIKSESSQRQR
jgi:hypothetical protein